MATDEKFELHQFVEKYYEEQRINTEIHVGVIEEDTSRFVIPFVGIEFLNLDFEKTKTIFEDLKRRISLPHAKELVAEFSEIGDKFKVAIQLGSFTIISDGRASVYPYFETLAMIDKDGVEMFLKYFKINGWFVIVAFCDGKPEPHLFLAVKNELKLENAAQ